MPKTLYDRDFQLWIQQTIQQLENLEFDALDIKRGRMQFAPTVTPFRLW